MRWLLLISLCAGACARAPYQYQPPAAASVPPASAGQPAQAGPQLMFLSFRMQAAPRQLELLKAVAVPGQVNAPEEEIGAAYLVLTQLDSRQQPCAAPLRVPHPLLRELEYPGEAGGTMARQAVALPEAEFFVRVARQPATVAVRLEEIAPSVAAPLTSILPLTFSKP